MLQVSPTDYGLKIINTDMAVVVTTYKPDGTQDIQQIVFPEYTPERFPVMLAAFHEGEQWHVDRGLAANGFQRWRGLVPQREVVCALKKAGLEQQEIIKLLDQAKACTHRILPSL